jgi:hypothetical protein
MTTTKSLRHFGLDSAASSSTDKTYTIKIRIDTRYPDPHEQVRQAVLTCNCPSWIFNKDTPKACAHTRDRAALLSTWQERQIKRVGAGLPIVGPDEQEAQSADSSEPPAQRGWLNDLALVSDNPKRRRRKKNTGE